MNEILNFHNPWLGLLLLLAAAGVWAAWRKRRPAVRVSALTPFKTAVNVNGGGIKKRLPTRIPLLIHTLGLVCLTIALMRPRKSVEHIEKQVEGIDIILALDVSPSMKAYDLGDKYQTRREILEARRKGELRPRIEVAQEGLSRFVENRPDDRIGLIVFSTYPYIVCPPTLDHDFLMENLKDLDIDLFAGMTGIAGPITAAANRLKASEAERKVIVLFSDGDNNVEAAITPLEAARLAEQLDITIHTVGIGSHNSVLITETAFGAKPQGEEGRFNEELLKMIADITDGQYFAARDEAGFTQVMKEIDNLETTPAELMVYMEHEDIFLPWLIAGIAFLLISLLLKNTVLQELP